MNNNSDSKFNSLFSEFHYSSFSLGSTSEYIPSTSDQELALPYIDVHYSERIRSIKKPALTSLIISGFVFLICLVIIFNIKIENVITVKGILEPLNMQINQKKLYMVGILLNQNEAKNILLGKILKFNTSLTTQPENEKLCFGKVTSITLEQNHNEQEASDLTKKYRVNILLDRNVFEKSNNWDLTEAIQINLKIKTDEELLFNCVVQYFKNRFQVF